jgi:hypothetical protein
MRPKGDLLALFALGAMGATYNIMPQDRMLNTNTKHPDFTKLTIKKKESKRSKRRNKHKKGGHP